MDVNKSCVKSAVVLEISKLISRRTVASLVRAMGYSGIERIEDNEHWA